MQLNTRCFPIFRFLLYGLLVVTQVFRLKAEDRSVLIAMLGSGQHIKNAGILYDCAFFIPKNLRPSVYLPGQLLFFE